MKDIHKIVDDIAAICPVIPVLTFGTVKQGEAACHALYAGGIRVFEITLRTPVCLEVAKRVAQMAKDVTVGIGTITRPEQCEEAVDVGARFGTSPGLIRPLIDAANAAALPLMPGVMTPSDILAALDAGFHTVKFFPTQIAGGMPMLEALYGPFPNVKFCPAGGVTAKNVPNFLSLPNVSCVGGSWLAPKLLLEEENWPEIMRLATLACQYGRHQSQGTSVT